jgi:hypothetical protein
MAPQWSYADHLIEIIAMRFQKSYDQAPCASLSSMADIDLTAKRTSGPPVDLKVLALYIIGSRHGAMRPKKSCTWRFLAGYNWRSALGPVATTRTATRNVEQKEMRCRNRCSLNLERIYSSCSDLRWGVIQKGGRSPRVA